MGGGGLFSSVLSKAREVAVLFKKNTSVRIMKSKSDANGMLIQVNFEFDGKNILLRSFFQNFYCISGLKPNKDKKKAVGFGDLVDCNVNLCTELGLQLVREFKLLGIRFFSSLENIKELNTNKTLSEIRKLLNNWKYRYLTPYDTKITVIKITHLSIVLPHFSAKLIKDLESLLFGFI